MAAELFSLWHTSAAVVEHSTWPYMAAWLSWQPARALGLLLQFLNRVSETWAQWTHSLYAYILHILCNMFSCFNPQRSDRLRGRIEVRGSCVLCGCVKEPHPVMAQQHFNQPSFVSDVAILRPSSKEHRIKAACWRLKRSFGCRERKEITFNTIVWLNIWECIWIQL